MWRLFSASALPLLSVNYFTKNDADRSSVIPRYEPLWVIVEGFDLDLTKDPSQSPDNSARGAAPGDEPDGSRVFFVMNLCMNSIAFRSPEGRRPFCMSLIWLTVKIEQSIRWENL